MSQLVFVWVLIWGTYLKFHLVSALNWSFFRYLSQLYSHPEWPQKTPGELRGELQENIEKSPFWLLGPNSMYKYLSRIIAKRRNGQPISFTDFFGHLVGETILSGVRIIHTI